MTEESRRRISLPYLRVNQKGMSFYLSKASASDLKQVVDFHFREPYKNYNDYMPKDFLALKSELEKRDVSINERPEDDGVQRALSRQRVREITRYIQDDPEALFPATVLLAIDTSVFERTHDCDVDELKDSGIFDIEPEMTVSVIDGQHRLAGLFLADDAILDQVEMPIVFMLNVSTPTAAKLFQHINGKQRKVNKSVIFDLFDNIPEESVSGADDLETKIYHTVCVSLYTNPDSPLYRQIKMLGVGGGAISQSFFIDTCKKELKCLNGKSTQERFDLLYDYFEAIQKFFPEDWPKPIGDFSDNEIDAYSKHVLKERKSQLPKTNGITAMLRILNWMMENKLSTYSVEALCGHIDWTEPYGTGGAAQTRLFEKLKNIICIQMGLPDEYR